MAPSSWVCSLSHQWTPLSLSLSATVPSHGKPPPGFPHQKTGSPAARFPLPSSLLSHFPSWIHPTLMTASPACPPSQLPSWEIGSRLLHLPSNHFQAGPLICPYPKTKLHLASFYWGWVEFERAALTYIHCQVLNRQLAGSCCIPQGAQPCALWWPRGVGSSRGSGCMYTQRWLTLLHSRNHTLQSNYTLKK